MDLGPVLSPGASPVAQMVENLPARQETWVRSLGKEDPLEEEMAAHSSLLVWRIPWTGEPGGLQSTGLQSQTRLSCWHVHVRLPLGLWVRSGLSRGCWRG